MIFQKKSFCLFDANLMYTNAKKELPVIRFLLLISGKMFNKKCLFIFVFGSFSFYCWTHGLFDMLYSKCNRRLYSEKVLRNTLGVDNNVKELFCDVKFEVW